MKKTKILGFILLALFYLIISVPFQSCKKDNEQGPDTNHYVVHKPNIYIYPTEQINLSVDIKFPRGGKVLVSIPEYGTGWNVNVEPSGLIDNTYSYLFYESTQPDIWQRQNGWTIQTDQLESFFRQNLSEYGFNGQEIDDFIEYWVPRLKDYPAYSIYPQTKSVIDNVIQLNFSKQPDKILRLFYFIKGQNKLQENLIEPTIDNFKREGYFVTEWGVVLD